MKRKDLIKTYHHLYVFHDLGDRMVCAYCGDVREEIDHVPPISLLHKVTTKVLRERNVEFILLPCCRTCNKLLGSKPLVDYDERLLYVYKKTMDKIETKTFWSDNEIEELDGHLKQMIKARELANRRELLLRLRGMELNLSRIESIREQLYP